MLDKGRHSSGRLAADVLASRPSFSCILYTYPPSFLHPLPLPPPPPLPLPISVRFRAVFLHNRHSFYPHCLYRLGSTTRRHSFSGTSRPSSCTPSGLSLLLSLSLSSRSLLLRHTVAGELARPPVSPLPLRRALLAPPRSLTSCVLALHLAIQVSVPLYIGQFRATDRLRFA